MREVERKYAEAVKQQETDDIKGSPDFQVEAFELDDLNVRVFNDTAVVTGRSTLRVIYKGQSNTNQFRYTRVYVKRKSGWQVVAQQLTRTSVGYKIRPGKPRVQ